jgi:hypothetical protein
MTNKRNGNRRKRTATLALSLAMQITRGENNYVDKTDRVANQGT